MKRYIKSVSKNNDIQESTYADIADYSFNDKIHYLYDENYAIHAYERMKQFAIYHIRHNNFSFACTILNVLADNPAKYYYYDIEYNPSESPIPIKDDSDIESIMSLYNRLPWTDETMG